MIFKADVIEGDRSRVKDAVPALRKSTSDAGIIQNDNIVLGGKEK